jgi:peptidyl-prolyl cis-trans isomerase SurA
MTEDGVASDLKSLLKSTDEGALTSVILLNGSYHIFYVAKKDLVESENYIAQKEHIRDELFEVAAKNEVALWFERESNKHFIKTSL